MGASTVWVSVVVTVWVVVVVVVEVVVVVVVVVVREGAPATVCVVVKEVVAWSEEDMVSNEK